MYTNLKKNLFVPIHAYKSSNTYIKIVDNLIINTSYKIRSFEFYHYVEFGINTSFPEFGWKIHVSAMNSNASEILRIVAHYCINNCIDFKFIRDEKLLSDINSKQWNRSSSGKFITIYPNNESIFIETLENLDILLRDFKGPYILSDKRFKNSQVLYYRFGIVKSDGSEVFKGPNGEIFSDDPQPYYQKPYWIEDPIKDDLTLESDEDEQPLLCNGRYLIKDALHITNSGGVYLAYDNLTGEDVLIKEARPYTSELVKGMDAVFLKKVEKEVLIEMEKYKLDFVPKYIDDFKEWEHQYLVTTYIKGWTLSEDLGSPENVKIIHSKNKEEIDKKFNNIKHQLISKLEKLWSLGISHGDITPENIIIDENGKFYIVDFELAITNEIANPSIKYLETDGFRISTVKEDFSNRFNIDKESLGLSILRMFCTGNKLVFLDEYFPMKFLSALNKDGILNYEQQSLIERLIYNNTEIGLSENHNLYETNLKCLEEILNKSCNLVLNSLDLNQENGTLFKTIKSSQRFSYLYGDLGIIEMLKCVKNNDLTKNIEMIYKEELRKVALQPKLTVPDILQIVFGMGKLDMEAEALSLLQNNEEIITHFYLNEHQSFTIDKGICGAALLYSSLYDRTQSFYCLNQIVKYADFIINEIHSKEDLTITLLNKTENKLGFYNGLSGIPYFLIKAFEVTKNENYLKEARILIEFIISLLIKHPTGTYIEIEVGRKTYAPYLNGATGFIKTLNYYNKFNSEYKSIIYDLIEPINFKYCKNATYLEGLAGMGEVLLEFYKENPQDLRLFNVINEINEGMILFSHFDNDYVAFSSNSLSNINLNYANGMSGIIHYLFQVLNIQKEALGYGN